METNSGTAGRPPRNAGVWVIPDVSYVEPQRRFCALCGRPIARRYWRAAHADAELAFCDPEHAKMYSEYLVPPANPDDHPTHARRERR